MKIFGWAADNGGCYFYRLGLPLGTLAEHGHDTHTSAVLTPDWRRDADIIIGQRVTNPGPSVTWQDLAAEGRTTLIYEIDDDLTEVDSSSPLAHGVFSDPETQARIRTNIAVASWVVCSTEALAEKLRRWNPDVRVVPNTIPASLLTLTRPRRAALTVGWAGSATHAMDWAEIRNPVRQYLRRNQASRLHTIGADYGTAVGLPEQTQHTIWQHEMASYYRAIDFDIGLAPLRPHLFNRSKSYIKCLEYAALGIPVIASNTGPYPGFVRDGETGFLVDRPHEWTRRLRQLTEDPDLRERMGTAARELAADHTIEGAAGQWAAAYGLPALTPVPA
ncbi:glycosyltransferase [Parafrankia discariae]|uniref:glycosyltransferase n=1 Tax=Parafrankia discariae TaxID=365528 RepID=UPI0003698CE3|nr:glycosyltransferase [Parafrankia discariae]